MSDKINKPKQPYDSDDDFVSNVEFPPSDDFSWDNIILPAEPTDCDTVLPAKPVLPPVPNNDIPIYTSPYIRGTSIRADDNEAVLMALINGEISLGDVQNVGESASKLRTARLEAKIQAIKDKQDAKKADAEALALDMVGAEAEAEDEDEDEDEAKIRAKIVFHNVPTVKGKDEADVAAYRDLQGVALRLCTIPDPSVFEILHKEFCWLENSIKYLEDTCDMARRGNGVLRFSPMLLLGPAGIGKTTLLRRFCELGHIPYILINAGGINDSMMLKGAHRSWTSSRPGMIVECIRQHKVANPIIIIDEIDKVGTSSHNGKFTDTLLQLLEPSSAEVWLDEFIQGRVDLSAVNYVLTANDQSALSGPLLSRTRSINADRLAKRDMLSAIPRIISTIANEYGISDVLLPPMDVDIADAMARSCRDLRKLKQAVQAWLLVAIKQADNHFGHTLH